MKEFLTLAFKNLKRRKLRSWLTIVGIFIGIAAVVGLISVSYGMEISIKEQLSAVGANKIMVSSGGGMGMGMLAASAKKITQKDADVIGRVPGIDVVTGMIYSSARAKYKDETKYTFIIGLPLDDDSIELFEDMQGFKIDNGRFMKEGSEHEAGVGWLIKEGEFFEKEVTVGKSIELEEEEFKVVGTMQRIGNPQDDSQIYISIDAARRILDKPEEYDIILARVKDGYDVKLVSERIKKELRDSRDEKKGEESFGVITMEEMIASVGNILAIVRVVIVAIAAISLLVGGIGIMNTMYTSVLERTKEIGTMKAIGARNSDIMLIFLFESGIYGLVGGAIGVIFGLGIGKLAEFIAVQFSGVTYIKASFALWLILGALLFSFVVGCISGAAPAWQASKLKPARALRYE